MSLSLRAQSLLLTALITVGVIGYLTLGFLPSQHSIGELRRQLEEKRRFVLDIDQQLRRADEIQQQIERIHASLSAAGDNNRHGTPGLLAAVTEGARHARVVVQRMNPGEPKPLASLEEQSLDLTVEGDFFQVFRFLALVEAWPGNVWFTQLHMKGAREFGQPLECRLNLTVFANANDSSD